MKKAKWISVKDRLPEHDGEVLAYCGGNIFIANCPEDEWVVYCLEEGGYSETCHVPAWPSGLHVGNRWK